MRRPHIIISLARPPLPRCTLSSISRTRRKGSLRRRDLNCRNSEEGCVSWKTQNILATFRAKITVIFNCSDRQRYESVQRVIAVSFHTLIAHPSRRPSPSPSVRYFGHSLLDIITSIPGASVIEDLHREAETRSNRS